MKQLYKHVAAGKVPAYRVGRSLRFDLALVLASTKVVSDVPPRRREQLPVVTEQPAAEPAPLPARQARKQRTRKQSVTEQLKALDPYVDLR